MTWASATLGVAPVAQAATDLTATDVRIGDHPAFVRAVVDFAHGEIRLPSEMLAATDPEPFADGIARVRLGQRGVRTMARTARGLGVTVRVLQGRNRITVRLTAAVHRFKYVSYVSLRNPERLVVDLWKSAPPVVAAQILRAPGGCLELTRYKVSARHAAAAGTERNLFENAFVVRLRAADGRVLPGEGQDRMTAPPRSRTRAATRAAGTRPSLLVLPQRRQQPRQTPFDGRSRVGGHQAAPRKSSRDATRGVHCLLPGPR